LKLLASGARGLSLGASGGGNPGLGYSKHRSSKYSDSKSDCDYFSGAVGCTYVCFSSSCHSSHPFFIRYAINLRESTMEGFMNMFVAARVALLPRGPQQVLLDTVLPAT
jgi:hypothetical protein